MWGRNEIKSSTLGQCGKNQVKELDSPTNLTPVGLISAGVSNVRKTKWKEVMSDRRLVNYHTPSFNLFLLDKI